MVSRRDLLKFFGAASAIPAVQSIEKLEASNGDTLIVTVPGEISDETARRIRDAFERTLKDKGIEVLVLGDGMQVKLLKRT